MTITVIGQITRDTLIFPDLGWHVTQGLGGILYTASALATLTKESVRLVCNVGSDVFDLVLNSLSKFQNIDSSAIQRIEGRHFHCYILFASEYGTQYDEGIDIPITFSQVKPFLDDSSFILVSPMTGFDLELRTLKQIRQAAKCPVYFDYHVLALDRDLYGNRFLRRRRNWLKWCSSCDHLQLNQFEVESLHMCSIDSEKEMINFSEKIINNGVKSVAVTLGGNGAIVCWKKRGKVEVEKIKATPVLNVVDATGCGDVFAAGFIVHFQKTGSFSASYEFANRIAGLKCSFHGFEGFADALCSTNNNLGV